MIGTDYPALGTIEVDRLQRRVCERLRARCNIINAPRGCQDDLLEPGAKSGGTPSPKIIQ